jgi:hypothetical protein
MAKYLMFLLWEGGSGPGGRGHQFENPLSDFTN